MVEESVKIRGLKRRGHSSRHYSAIQNISPSLWKEEDKKDETIKWK